MVPKPPAAANGILSDLDRQFRPWELPQISQSQGAPLNPSALESEPSLGNVQRPCLKNKLNT